VLQRGTASVCGDGELGPDEACDDMSDAPFDGCDACQVAVTLVWQYDFDHEGGDDEVTALAPDGPSDGEGGRVRLHRAERRPDARCRSAPARRVRDRPPRDDRSALAKQ
jgi:cysteine-rich repeat protein